MQAFLIGLLATMLTLTVIRPAKIVLRDVSQFKELNPKQNNERENEEHEEGLSSRVFELDPQSTHGKSETTIENLDAPIQKPIKTRFATIPDDAFFTDGSNYILITNWNVTNGGDNFIFNDKVGTIGKRTVVVQDNKIKIDGKVLRPRDWRDVDFGRVKMLADGTMMKHVVNDTFVTTSDMDTVVEIVARASGRGCGASYRRCHKNSHCCPEAPVCSGLGYRGQSGGLCAQCFRHNGGCYRNDQCCENRCVGQKCQK